MLVFILWLMKYLINSLNNRFVDHLEKNISNTLNFLIYPIFSTPDLLKVISDRIARASNRSKANRVIARDLSKAFNRV